MPSVLELALAAYSLAVSGLYFRADNQRAAARERADIAEAERAAAVKARERADRQLAQSVVSAAMVDLDRPLTSTEQAVAAGHPSADGLGKNRGGL